MRQTPNAHKNVDVYFLTNPVGVDLIVDALQRKFDDTFNWLEKPFARAVKMGTTDDQGNEKEFPAMFTADKQDFANMLNLDNYDSYCFFYAEDEEEMFDEDEYNQFIPNRLQRTLHVIFWIDMKRIDPSRTENWTEEIKQDIWKAIGETYFPCDTSAAVVNTFDEPDQIFDPFFTFNFVESQNMGFPKIGLRFELLACYTNDIDGYNSPINQPITSFTYNNNNQSILTTDPFLSMTATVSPSQRTLYIIDPNTPIAPFVSLNSSNGLIMDNGLPKVVGNYNFSVIAIVNSQIASCFQVTITVN